MNEQKFMLMQRRGELLATIASQREQMTEIGKHMRTPLALADSGVAALRYFRRHPLHTSMAAFFLIRQRRGVAGLMRGTWRLWRVYRLVTLLLAKKSQ